MEPQPVAWRYLLIGMLVLLGSVLAFVYLRLDKKVRKLIVAPESTEGESAENLRAVERNSSSKSVDSVNFVGAAACAKCHENEHQSYLLTAHSRAMGLVDPDSEPPDGNFYHEPSQRSYSVDRHEGKMWHAESGAATPKTQGTKRTQGTEVGAESVPEVREPVKYLVGSGRHSRTYLVEQDGFLMESPISWYSSTKDWRMSPGYDRASHDGFERSADQGCLICHVGRFEPIDGAMNRLTILETSIGCERCHGPGAAHVAKWKDHPAALLGTVNETDDSIVHPGHLTRELKEAICSQCHLRGDATVIQRGHAVSDFLPGTPLTETRIDYRLEADNGEMKVVGHVDQMYASRCYQQSTSLTCTTCHDAHAETIPDLASGFYRNKCIECHGDSNCRLSLPERHQQDASDNCIKCHMPQVPTDIPHIAFTHHRIGIHIEATIEKTSNESPGGLVPREAAGGSAALRPQPPSRLVPFGDLAGMTEIQQQRCLGLACAEFADKQPNPDTASEYRSQAIQLLKGVADSGEADGDVFAALARFAWEEENPSLAIDYAQRAIANPDLSAKARVNSLLIVGDCFLQARQSAQAVAPLEQLVKLRRHSQDWFLLGISRFQSGQQQSGLAAVKHATQIQPFRTDVRKTLSEMQRAAGK